MNFKCVVNQKSFVIILSAIVVCFLFFAGSDLYSTFARKTNQKLISNAFELFDENPDADVPSALTPILERTGLSPFQKYQLYARLSEAYFQSGKMDDFLEVIGYALFYSSFCKQIEETVYFYALLAQYYLELGADKSGYEMILNARLERNFYSLENPVIQSQALHAYGRFLLYESDFEDAIKAQNQMEENAKILEESKDPLAKDKMRCSLAFKAYIMMCQGNTEQSYQLAKDVYEKYFNPEEKLSHFTVYDFLLPIIWVKTHWAIRNHYYERAIEFNHEYGRLTRKYNFIMKKTSLSKELLFALPYSMVDERNQLSTEIALDTDMLSQTFLENFTGLTGEKLSNVMQNLRYTTELEASRRAIHRNIALNLMVFLFFILIIFVVYSEIQIDGLTKLRNRRALNMKIGHLSTSGKKYSAIMIDIDNFKKLNDTYGHDFGDEVLRGVAQILLNAENKYIKSYRYGGEEMVVIMEHYDFERSVRLSESLRNEISIKKWRKDVHVTASFGLGFEMQDTLKEADENMYVAKQKGKNFTAYKKDGKQYLAERRLDIRNYVPDRKS